MASERDRKKVDELPAWQQIKAAFTGGYDNEKAQQAAASASQSSAMQEAIKRRRIKGA